MIPSENWPVRLDAVVSNSWSVKGNSTTLWTHVAWTFTPNRMSVSLSLSILVGFVWKRWSWWRCAVVSVVEEHDEDMNWSDRFHQADRELMAPLSPVVDINPQISLGSGEQSGLKTNYILKDINSGFLTHIIWSAFIDLVTQWQCEDETSSWLMNESFPIKYGLHIQPTLKPQLQTLHVLSRPV